MKCDKSTLAYLIIATQMSYKWQIVSTHQVFQLSQL